MRILHVLAVWTILTWTSPGPADEPQSTHTQEVLDPANPRARAIPNRLFATDLNYFYFVDESTGNVTLIVRYSDVVFGAEGLAYRPADAQLYTRLVVVPSGFFSDFVRIDPRTGNVSLANYGLPGNGYLLSFTHENATDSMWFSTRNPNNVENPFNFDLWKGDPGSWAANYIATIHVPTQNILVTSLAFHPHTGELYGLCESLAGFRIAHIDVSAGTLTVTPVIFSLPLYQAKAMSFEPTTGILYVWSIRRAPISPYQIVGGTLWLLEASTGAVLQQINQDDYGSAWMTSIAFAPALSLQPHGR